MTENATKLTPAQRRERAVSLRLAGLPFRRIGEELHVSHMAAFRMVTAALAESAERHREETDLLREIELRRLDEAQVVTSALLRHADPTVKLRAVDKVVRLSERRSRLCGLDAPSVLAGVDLSKLSDDQMHRIAKGESVFAVLSASVEPSLADPPPPHPAPAPPAEDEDDADEGEVVGDSVVFA